MRDSWQVRIQEIVRRKTVVLRSLTDLTSRIQGLSPGLALSILTFNWWEDVWRTEIYPLNEYLWRWQGVLILSIQSNLHLKNCDQVVNLRWSWTLIFFLTSITKLSVSDQVTASLLFSENILIYYLAPSFESIQGEPRLLIFKRKHFLHYFSWIATNVFVDWFI